MNYGECTDHFLFVPIKSKDLLPSSLMLALPGPGHVLPSLLPHAKKDPATMSLRPSFS